MTTKQDRRGRRRPSRHARGAVHALKPGQAVGLLARAGIDVSPAQPGRILARTGISLQRTGSWKQSPDPDYEQKATGILALYRDQPKDGVVISFDEKDPIFAAGGDEHVPESGHRRAALGARDIRLARWSALPPVYPRQPDEPRDAPSHARKDIPVAP